MKKNVLSALLVCSIALTTVSLPVTVSANEYDTKIQEQNQKIDTLKTKEAEAEKNLQAIETQMKTASAKIDELTEKKSTLTKEITDLYNEISDLNVRIQKREVQMQKQARDLQVSGNGTGYLELLLSSESLSDALSRMQGLTTLVNANNDLLTQQTQDKETVVKKTDVVDGQIKTLETATNELTDKQAALDTLKIEQEVAKNELEAQRATEESKKTEFVSQKEAAEKKLADELAKQEKERQERERLAQELINSSKVNVIENDGTTSEINRPAGNTNNNNNNSGGSANPSMPNTEGVSSAKKAAISAAIADCGNTYPTGWGAQGECLVSVRRWLSAGGISFAVGGPHSGYTASGAKQVSWSEVQPGDVVQYENIYSPDGWLDGVHTVLIVGVNGDGSVQIVEANNPAYSGYVSSTNGWSPRPSGNFRAVVWRFPG